MTYYRIALRPRHTNIWTWKTTVLYSLQAVFQLLRSYSALPQDCIRVFAATSKEELNEMLRCENTNRVSGSATAAQFLQERMLQVSGQSAAAYSTTEPAVRQATAVATGTSPHEYSAAPGFASFGNTTVLERKRLEIESGAGGDHDLPYCFTLPVSTPQLLAWIRLQRRVQAGEVQP